MNSPFLKFDQEHGEPEYENGTYYYPDGAKATGGDLRGSTFFEPPMYPEERVKAKRVYLELKLAREIKEFRTAKADFESQCALHLNTNGGCPPPPDKVVEWLEGKKDRINILKKELADFNAQFSQTPQSQKRAESLETDRRQRQKVKELSSRIQSIDL